MKNKKTILTLALIALTATVTASDYIIEDSNGDNLFVVNETGEKQIQNGNLYLNGNKITDQEGTLTLDGGNVEIPNGNLDISNNVKANSFNLKSSNYAIRYDSGTDSIQFRDTQNGDNELWIRRNGDVQIPNGNLNMNENRINNVGRLDLGWANLTDYPNGCGPEEAVRVIGDTLDCVSLDPSGSVGGGGEKGEIAFYIDGENITGSNNLYWNNSQTRLGLATSNPSATLDVNGDAQVNGQLNLKSNEITGITNLEGTNIVNNNQISSGAISKNKLSTNSVGINELDSTTAGDGLSGGSGSALSVNTGTGITTNSDKVQIDTTLVPRKNTDETITANQWTYQNDVQIRGNLDVWGNVQNTDVSNLNINGSLLPPSGYTDTFNVGSSSRRWKTGYFQDITLGNNAIDNSEITNTDITINANSGLSGGGTTNLGGSTGLSHADTSNIGNIDNSGGTIIQDLNFDGYGHVTGQNSYNLDNRYYTETESDSNFVDESGDTMTGPLNISDNEIEDARGISFSNNGDSGYIREYSGGALAINSQGNALRLQDDNSQLVSIESSLNMNSNLINNFFGSNCASDEVVESVNSDGTYNCKSITGTADDTYVNEGGDTMTGALDMSGNNVQNVGTINASTIQENGNDIGGLFVDESGDSMSGSLNMQGHHVDNLNYLDLNSEGQIQTDGTDAIRFDGSQNIEIPNGNLNIRNGGMISFTNDDYIGHEGNDIRMETGRNMRLVIDGEGGGESYHDLEVRNSNGDNLLDVSPNGNIQIPNGYLDMNSNDIRNLETPDSGTDAATKDYVDAQTGDAESGATQTLSQVLSEGNDAGSQAITSIGSGNIDIDGSGSGNIQLNNEEVRGGSITQSNNLIAGSYSTGESSVDGGDVWVENDVEVGGDIVGSGADVAEKINNESQLEPGTVVTISGNNSVDKTQGKHDRMVAGVVSTDPAMVMAKERDGVPIAMTGTVPVKVTMENGEIKPGDMLTTSSAAGKAMKCQDLTKCTGSIIGKALEPAEKTSKINMLISMS
ncbi:hypothetical protein [Candidatus Nanohalobium constans]|uniref:Uncharacterized protein n=1 Tax=Candidatus Nanohalobium constans TaxID=2565781 RepID=A0A5Q0UFF4_9ARCH|nr:hypothetical protein [Candidatus Nanohalobium constans]QGA80318.1 hypothetical protein LC1Nh_0417 [Candidatus Nanohalobium constans]